MLRIVVRTDDAGMAANVGGSVLTTIKTFDIEHPEIERLLRQEGRQYVHSQVVGIELLEADHG